MGGHAMIELDDGRGPYAERKPGDFKRRGNDGAPYVSDPTGAVVKSGERKGEVKWCLYGRPSSFGKQIENAYNLLRWKERTLVLGCADPEVADLASKLVGRDRDTPEWRSDADGVVAAAYRAAKAMEAAERGSHMHLMTELDDSELDWVKHAEAGEDMGIPRETQEAMLAAWRTMLERFGLVILAVETPVVNDIYRQAGTLDRIATLTRDLTFVVDGELVTIPADTNVVLDIKTGKMTREGNAVQYWHSYAIQVCTYAGAVPYDVATETRGEWGWRIDQRWALIAHLPVLEALEGTAVCRLVLVDLNAGRNAAELCVRAAAWERCNDVFGFVHDEADVEVPIGPTKLEQQLESSLARLDPHRLWGPLPEGYDTGTITDEALKLTRARVNALPAEARTILEHYARQAHEVGRSFSISTTRSTRRYLIYRALLTLAEKHREGLDDDLVRATVAMVLPEAGQLAVPLGAAIGSLDPTEAARFLDVAIAVTAEDVALQFSDDGSPRWDLVA
jgi:hypothetical protein